MEAAIAIVGGLFSAEKIAGLTIPQIITIATALYNALPQEKALIVALHPLFSDLGAMLDQGMTPEAAAAAVAPKIPGYSADGSVTEIKNPDAP
jgi:hypothetical protein